MMFIVRSFLATLFGEEKGAELAEYGLVLGLVAVASIAALTLLGGNISTTMNNVAGSILGAGG
ncbi:MAG: Flp family type IVb pilin [Chloroflexi bacterium]|nr:MAG: Flp family type IVb pilin [Chloroflexota bacterium]